LEVILEIRRKSLLTELIWVRFTALTDYWIAVCTIEKANSLINRLMEDNRLSELGCIVVDEVHMIGDPSRGYLLELMLTKIKYMLDRSIQIVGMSATLPNVDVLAQWLDAQLYMTDFRPVPLTEYVKIENKIYDKDWNVSRTLKCPKDARDPDMMAPLVWETVSKGHSVLIFCPTKDMCEKVARLIASCMALPVEDAIVSERRAILNELRKTPGGLDLVLEACIPGGVAYHHSVKILAEALIV
jgi:replicative superfamily II helicase